MGNKPCYGYHYLSKSYSEYLTNSCTTSVMVGKKDILGFNLYRKYIFINYHIKQSSPNRKRNI